MNFSGWEILVVLFIVLLLFGSSRLPQLAKGMGKSIREFKRGVSEGETEAERVGDAPRRESLRAGDEAAREDELARERATLNRPR